MTHKHWILGTMFALALIGPAGLGCGDDDGGGNQNNATVHLSDDLLTVAGAPADFSCIGTPDPALSFPAETEISGIVTDFEQGWAVQGIVVSVYSSLADLLAGNAYDTAAPTDPAGAYTLSAPANVTRMHFKMVPESGQEYFPTMEIEEPVAGMPPGPPQATGKDRIAVSAATMASVPAIMGIIRIEGRGIVAGRFYDCNRDEVEHGALRVFDRPEGDPARTLISIYEGANRNSFYFIDGMPIRSQMYTDIEGQFLIANLVSGSPVTVELWGRLDPASLPGGYEDCTGGCKLSTQEVPVLPDSLLVTDMIPLYTSP